MSETSIKNKPGQKGKSDNKTIALANRKVKKDRSNCPLIEEVVVKNCDSCSLKVICDGIDNVN